MRWSIPVVGTILAVTDKLTTWWGIAIVVVLAILHLLAALAGPVDPETRKSVDEPDVYEFVGFLVITLPMVVGLFVGYLIADAVGAAVGSVALGIAGSFVWSRIVVRTEREIEARESREAVGSE